jgi:hypothetical protein
MRLADLSPFMLVRCDDEKALLRIETVYEHCCTAVVVMYNGRRPGRRKVRAYLAHDIARFVPPSAEAVSEYEATLEGSAS